ncbi:cell death abnormality protein 1-like [Saccostrea cucullata]|uniref:cell death abnormality protein 1-like n=1 Tax=Saccostrea cuccullata TaxID=36930 RepID=UPI002ED6BB56
MKLMKVRSQIFYHLIVVHICTKTHCSKLCGNRCCLNFYQSPDGECLECPLGTNGVNCTQKCVKGYFGRLCRLHCNCPAEECDGSFGCPKTNTVGKDTESQNEWVNMLSALIGSVITMSLIGLLFYLKSWNK